jgi:hypothetical protein
MRCPLGSIAGAADCLSLAFAPVFAPERIAAPAAFDIAASFRLREDAQETLPGFGGLGMPVLASRALGLGIQMHPTREDRRVSRLAQLQSRPPPAQPD